MHENINDDSEYFEHSWVFYFDDDKDFVCEGYKGAGWYFWDETETYLIGPFTTQDRADIALNVYVAGI